MEISLESFRIIEGYPLFRKFRKELLHSLLEILFSNFLGAAILINCDVSWLPFCY